MKTKNMILLAVLAVQVVLIAVAMRPSDRGSASVMTFLPGIAADSVSEVTINDEQSGIVLKKSEAGWQVADGTETYPADPAKVKDLIVKLTGLESSRPVTRTKSSHARLKVAEHLFQRQITVTAGSTSGTLYLGTAPSYKTLHVRAADDNEVYLVKDLTVWDIQANRESWWQTRLIDMPDKEISAVSLVNEKGRFRLVKDAAGNWRVEGNEAILDPAGVDTFLAQAGQISVLKFLGRDGDKKFGLERPLATLTVESTGASLVLRVGALNSDESNHVVKADHSPFYATVADYVAEPLLTMSAVEFSVQKQEQEQAVSPGTAETGNSTAPETQSPAQGEQEKVLR